MRWLEIRRQRIWLQRGRGGRKELGDLEQWTYGSGGGRRRHGGIASWNLVSAAWVTFLSWESDGGHPGFVEECDSWGVACEK